MAIAAAHALTAKLDVRLRNEKAEWEALEHIAAWAAQFTPMVSLAPPDSVVLEVRGSLELFGGLENLLARLKSGLEELGYEACIAIAPTPLGATWLARAGSKERVTDLRRLHSRLAPLPVHSLRLDADTLEKFSDLGLRYVGDCLRLPRDGLVRRFGPQLLLDLERALGRAPDPRRPFVPPPCFSSRLLLPVQVDNREALLFAIHRLLLELVGFLRARGSSVQELSLKLDHPNGSPTQVVLTLVTPSRDVHHLRELLRVRLEQLTLREPVEQIRLATRQIRILIDQNQDLFTDREAPEQAGSLSQAHRYQLIEHLRARLGDDAVHGLCLVPEHRPERAYRPCAPGESGPRVIFGLRPLWLLVEPLPLAVVQGRPWLHGLLSLLRGPERIESGWWDGHDAARDYFVAKNPRGSRFWIFRERRKPCGWFLHGIFA